MIGGFFDRYHASWSEPELIWFEALLEHEDVDAMAFALGTREPPGELAGPLLEALRKLDYVTL